MIQTLSTYLAKDGLNLEWIVRSIVSTIGYMVTKLMNARVERSRSKGSFEMGINRSTCG